MKSGAQPRSGLAALTLLLVLMLLAAPAASALRLALSPLTGTPDASPQTQISFLGAPASEISDISVSGSLSGSHSGRLESYRSSPGASFLPASPFTQGEQVTVSALAGPRGHTERVATSFTVAHLSSYRPPSSSASAPAPAGATQSFASQPALHPPKVAVTTSAPGATPGDVFLTSTHGLGQSGPMIVDGGGNLVWYKPLPSGQVAADLQVESYGGHPVLVWWQGEIPATLGVGFGTDEIYSPAYTPIASLPGGNGYRVDLHDIQITPAGSAFVSAYSLVDADLSSVGGSPHGALQDAILQEIDVATGLVMFEWHAYGHVSLGYSYSRPSSDPAKPWDFFHLNSISLDPWGDGNFIVSSRNTWAAYEIDHFNGAVLWRLGGKRSSFKMGPGTGTAWQHDVRWQPDDTLTIFDNGAVPPKHSQSRAIHERVDWTHRKVTLIGRDIRTPPLLTGSQGDDQTLPDGSSFVGWGEQPYFTEFSPTGQIVFEGRLPSPGQSYRAFRFPWSATPAAPPSLALAVKGATVTVYASWNGATSVSAWRVLGGAAPRTLAPIATAPSSGFETQIAVQSPDAYFAVQALGAGGEMLGASAAARR
ncbi:MAG TPA: arylsulfotransferase family protein [Solirubrobacteraceae bacterium]|nr:arylsulfotransferase family protein [Solirubrobacteraceae bacterium]